MIAAAVVALICAGLFTDSPRLVAASLVCLTLGPFISAFYVLARRLGWNTLFR
jgi:hypothetical protein